MSRCRATSFFVSPNDRRYFRDLTIATKDGDDWVVFTHRNDIGKYQATHPDWGGVCFIGPTGGATALQETLDTHPEQVERWVLDERVANGRAPGGPAAAIYQLASRGPVALSARQLSERLFPDANKPLRHASEAAVTAPSGAFALSVAVVLRERLGDDVAATTLKKMEEWSTLHVSAADPRELSSLFDILAGRYGTQRARTLFGSLADVNQLPTEWRIVLAKNTSDTGLLAALSVDENADVRQGVAKNPAAPPETLAALSVDESANVRRAVARNPATPQETQAALSVDEDRNVRRAVAHNLAATPAVLAALSVDKDDYVRFYVAENTAIPPETLAALSADEDRYVRCVAAENPTATPAVLAALSVDENANVRRGVAENPAATPAVLATLSVDKADYVRRAVAENPATPPAVLAALSGADEWDVRRVVAKNPATPPDALTALSVDENADVRQGVAKNPAAPPETLAALSVDKADYVRRGVAENPATPQETQAALSVDEDRNVRRAVALNLATPPETLAALSVDEDWDVRYGVANNSATPPGALTALSVDENADVRQGVAKNPAAPAAIRAAILVASRDSADHAAAAMLDVPWDAPRPDHPGLSHLREVSMVAVSGVEVKWPDKPGSIFDLPGRGALPWSIDSAALTLNNKVVHDGSKKYTLEVLESPHALKQNANDMGNCTYKSYAKHVAEGRCVIVALRGKGEKNEDKIFYNAEFIANDDGTWALGQVNSIRNEGNVPPLVTQQLRDYAKSITA